MQLTEVFVAVERHHFAMAGALTEMVARTTDEIMDSSRQGVAPSWAVPRLLEIAQLTKSAFGSAPSGLVGALLRLSDADLLGCELDSAGNYRLMEHPVMPSVVLCGLNCVSVAIDRFLEQARRRDV